MATVGQVLRGAFCLHYLKYGFSGTCSEDECSETGDSFHVF